ncbi:MAG: hypothetical protein WCS67_01530 [Bacteroidales bacterium]
MILTALTAAAALASAIYGTVKSEQQNRKANRLLNTQVRDNKRWYSGKLAENYIDRSDVQSALGKQRELLSEQYKNARATNTVAGGTEQSLVAQKEAANRSVGDTIANVAANASSYKDDAERLYLNRDAQLKGQQIAEKKAQAAETAKAASQVSGALSSFAGSLAGAGTKADGSTGDAKALGSNADNVASANANLNDTIKDQFLSQPVKKPII